MARGCGIQMIAQRKLQQAYVDDVVALGHPNPVTKLPNALRVPTTSQTAQRRHSRIIPTVHDTFFNQTQQFAFGHDGVIQVQPSEFPLLGRENAEMFNVPIIQGPVVFKFKRA